MCYTQTISNKIIKLKNCVITCIINNVVNVDKYQQYGAFISMAAGFQIRKI